jgi:ribonucleoside-diphosphate reductase alpha chain
MVDITYDEAYAASLEYFRGEALPAKVFLDKYALRDNDGNILEATPDQMHRRIARELARIESRKFKTPMSEDEIYSCIEGFRRIIPQGSPQFAIGNPYQYCTISNCYVVDTPTDSFGGIHHTDEQLSQISKRRGGVGLDLSLLRPDGTPTQNSARTSTGIVPFMERFSNTIREVGQSGRRGALMLTIDVHHPQVLDFATVKRDLSKVTGANISVRLSDEFLNAVKSDSEYEQRWPVDKRGDDAEVSRMIRARDVWNGIIENAHHMAEPGLLFWDNIIRNSPADAYANEGFETVSTNPCSELPLSVLDSCRLLLLNLLSYVRNPFADNSYFDFEAFRSDSIIAQRLMDNIIDLELESVQRIIDKVSADPEPQHIKAAELDLWKRVYDNCYRGRRTGTGITALGDAMAAIGIRYGSEESVVFTEKVYRELKLACYRSSVDMAKELGAFPIWDKRKEAGNEFLDRLWQEDEELARDHSLYGRRNIALLTTAPAGSVSIESDATGDAFVNHANRYYGTTSGIEPLFMLSFIRRKKINPDDVDVRVDFVDQSGDSWQEFTVYHPTTRKWMEVTGKTDVNESPWYGCCAEDISWVRRVDLQAAAQRHVDHAISSTINLPEDVSVEQVAEIYEAAWMAGCKGITVYRKNCRTGVLIEESAKKATAPETITKTTAPKRPKTLPCDVYHVTVRGEEYLVIVSLLEGDVYEVIVCKNGFVSRKIKHGSLKRVKRGHYDLLDDAGEIAVENITERSDDEEEALARVVSVALRHGAALEFLVHQLEKSKGSMLAFSKALARTLKRYIPDGTKVSGETCPSCASVNIVRGEGCVTCAECGWSKCS